MNTKRCLAILNQYASVLQVLAGCQGWDITWRCKRIEQPAGERILAAVAVDYDYRQAVIEVDNEHIETVEQLLKAGFHELLHVKLSSPWKLFRRALEASAPDHVKATAAPVYTNANEQMIDSVITILEDATGREIGAFLKGLSLERTAVRSGGRASRRRK